MGGMALGSWLVSRSSPPRREPLLGYATPSRIGVPRSFHRVFQGATGWAFETVLPSMGGAGTDFFKWGWRRFSSAGLICWGRLSLMSAGIIRLYPQASGRALSMLYFTNTSGRRWGAREGFY